MLRALTVALLALVTAGGCAGDDADPHALVACEPGWGAQPTVCEAACQTMPMPAVTDTTCTFHRQGNIETTCIGGGGAISFVISAGVRGCCVLGGAHSGPGYDVWFYECE